MTQIARWLTVVLLLCVTAAAGVTPATISGYVRDSAGTVQMGAMVELASGAVGQSQVAFTDSKGHFTLGGLLPGNYDVRVSAPAFLPTLREDVAVAEGASKVLNITLSTLFEVVRMVPPRKATATDDDSWKWTLRSTANRPILRFDDDTPVIVESAQHERVLRGSLAFLAGGVNEGYGSASDRGTAFVVERSIFSTGTVALDGNLGAGDGTPDGVLRVSYKRQQLSGQSPEVALSIRRFTTSDVLVHHGDLQAIALAVADGFTIGDVLEFQYGGEAETIQFMGRANAFRPYGALDVHLTGSTVLEFRYATTEPNTRGSKGFDSAPADFSESGPRMTLVNGDSQIENAHHEEISLSQRILNTNFQFALFNDRITNPALLGVGNISTDTGDILPDVYSGTFSYNGGRLEAQGLRVVAQHKICDQLVGTVDYAYGGVLAPEGSYLDWSDVRSSLHHEWAHTAALKLNGSYGRNGAKWIASYRWTSSDVLTPVDMFNASAGQTDPGFSFFWRQPIPHFHGMPGRMEALVDLRNLLAEGYVPVYGPDGRTIYLVQSARSVRGGLAFTF